MALAAEGLLPPLRLALLDFEDRAGFQAEWHLSREVPDLLGRYLDADDAIFVIPTKEVEAVQLNKQFKKYQGIDRAVRLGLFLDADVVITGIVEKLGMRRVTVGNPNLAGYKSYNSVIHLSQVELIRVATGEIVETFETLRDSTEKSYGLDLFGRPREQDRVFRELFKVDFGSERFFELAFGELVDVTFRSRLKTYLIRLSSKWIIAMDQGFAMVGQHLIISGSLHQPRMRSTRRGNTSKPGPCLATTSKSILCVFFTLATHVRSDRLDSRHRPTVCVTGLRRRPPSGSTPA